MIAVTSNQPENDPKRPPSLKIRFTISPSEPCHAWLMEMADNDPRAISSLVASLLNVSAVAQRGHVPVPLSHADSAVSPRRPGRPRKAHAHGVGPSHASLPHAQQLQDLREDSAIKEQAVPPTPPATEEAAADAGAEPPAKTNRPQLADAGLDLGALVSSSFGL